MNYGDTEARRERGGAWLAAVVFVVVLAAQLALVAVAGTDIPWGDAWDVEGRGLYPAWRDGTWRAVDFFRTHNEHRIFWTKALDVGLFSVNGQWDPLVQLVVGAGLRALAAGGAGLLAMGGAALVPVALIGLVGLRAVERRRWSAARSREVWPAVGLLVAAWALRAEVREHAALQAQSAGQWGETFLRALAWPQAWQPWAALVLNAPLAWIVVARVRGKRRASAGEDFVVLCGGWAVSMAAAMAWSRGASGEFAGAVPSRYADFLVLLPLANAGCAVVLVREARAEGGAGGGSGARVASVVGAAWGLFLLIGWAGLSGETMQRIILPRMRDREAPVRLAVAFQRSGDAAVFAGQPRLLVPHPNPESVRAVLEDTRMRGVLPPSLQLERPMGPLSRAVRWVLGRE